VEHISSSAFQGCTGLTSINIPDSVTRIGSSAFYGGSTELTVTYKGATYVAVNCGGYYDLPDAFYNQFEIIYY
jgi:hypothetical protein